MKSKWKGLIAALVVVLLAGGAVTVKAALDLNRSCSITFGLENDGTAFDGDLVLEDITGIRLYQIAGAVANDRDSYDFDVVDSYVDVIGNLDLNDASAEEFEALADSLAEAVTTQEPVDFEEGKTTYEDLDAGLYLAVIDDVNSSSYTYKFRPMLISVPTGDTLDNSASREGMNFDVAVTLKTEQVNRTTDVQLKKTFTSFNEAFGKATVVFNVDIVWFDASTNSTKTDSRVVGLTFDSLNLTKTYTLEAIPVGATVYVKEVYTGAAYKTDVTSIEYVVLSPDELEEGETQVIGFTNYFDNEFKMGYGYVNHFDFNDDDSEWHWTRLEDSPVIPGVDDRGQEELIPQ